MAKRIINPEAGEFEPEGVAKTNPYCEDGDITQRVAHSIWEEGWLAREPEIAELKKWTILKEKLIQDLVDKLRLAKITNGK